MSRPSPHDRVYLDLVERILREGATRGDRTGVGTRSIFGAQCIYDLREGFPLLTTKHVNFDLVVGELRWFLEGSTDVKRLHELGGGKIWDAWADEDGYLGPIYGAQWRRWRGERTVENGPGLRHTISTICDQLRDALALLRRDPSSRRNVVSAWNVADIPEMRLPPCHVLFQFYADGDQLDLQFYQRSADMALGVPFNIASYALLLTLFAALADLRPRHLIHSLGDAHIYLSHLEGIHEQLRREPRPAPSLFVYPGRDAYDMFAFSHELLDYDPHPAIRFPVAV